MKEHCSQCKIFSKIRFVELTPDGVLYFCSKKCLSLYALYK